MSADIETASTLPPRPNKPRQFTQAELAQRFAIKASIFADGRVKVDPAWEKTNLVEIRLPAVFGIPSAFRMHKDAAPVFQRWFRMLSDSGLYRCVATFNGAYVPRLKRGKIVPKTVAGLSRHARGIAIDFNAAWNPMGKPPAPIGSIGSLVEIAPLANECGIVWGGDWRGASQDGMHFELGMFEGL